MTTFLTVSLWCTVIWGCLVFLNNCERHHLSAKYLASDSLIYDVIKREGLVDWSQLSVDSLNIVRVNGNLDDVRQVALHDCVIREEFRSGRLMTIEEMAERITGYYDKLIDVLIFLLGVFSLVGYFVIKDNFKRQYEEEKNVIKQDLKEALLDSHSLIDDIKNGISTKLQDSLVTKDDIQGIYAKLKKNDEWFELLAWAYDEVTEKEASRIEIEGDEENEING